MAIFSFAVHYFPFPSQRATYYSGPTDGDMQKGKAQLHGANAIKKSIFLIQRKIIILNP